MGHRLATAASAAQSQREESDRPSAVRVIPVLSRCEHIGFRIRCGLPHPSLPTAGASPASALFRSCGNGHQERRRSPRIHDDSSIPGSVPASIPASVHSGPAEGEGPRGPSSRPPRVPRAPFPCAMPHRPAGRCVPAADRTREWFSGPLTRVRCGTHGVLKRVGGGRALRPTAAQALVLEHGNPNP